MRKIDVSPADRPKHIEPGAAPMLQWVAIEHLVIDDSYQRDLKRENWNAIRKIAARFKWSRFSPVFVAPIEGGRYAIIDGQHRTHAAAICGFVEVPCQIVQMSREEQAASFAVVNGAVTKVTILQIYKAAQAAGEEWAQQIASVCGEAGMRMLTYAPSAKSAKAGDLVCVAFIRDFIARRGPEAATAALTIFRSAEGVGDTAEFYALKIFKAILEALASRPHCLARADETAKFLTQTDLWKIVEEAEAFVAQRRRAGLPSVAARDLLESLVGDALDKALPQRMALPAPAKSEAA